MARLPLDKTKMEAHLQGIITSYSPDAMLPLPDGVLSFTHRLVVELSRDCLAKHQRGLITETYLEDLQQNIETLLQQAGEKSEHEELAFIKELAEKVLCVIPRLPHSLDCLETPEGRAKEEQNGTTDSTEPNTSHQELPKDLILETSGLANNDQGKSEPPEIDESASNLIRSLDVGRKPCKSHFETSTLISSGTYGTVHLVHHTDTRRAFAMKKIEKQNLFMADKFQQAFLERDILMFIESPFIVNMVCSFSSQRHLCMIMEYIGGGDCGTLIKYGGPISVNLARLYFAEMVLALEHLHSYGVVHRDLKPDNLLITPSGHIKVTDFGLSKLGLMRLTSNNYKAQMEDITKEFLDNEVCGTLEYIAPEMLLMEGYGRPIDWWAMGIILHEFLLGSVPFFGSTTKKVFNAVIKDDVTWNFDNKAPPPDAQDLITELLRKNPARRLGTGGAHEVKIHPFMSDINFDCILSQQPEYIPELVSAEDTSNFEPHSEKHHLMASDEGEDTSEDIGYTVFAPFTSSTKRFSKLCTHTTRMTDNNMEDPKLPPEDSPVSDSDMQRQLFSSEADDEKQRHNDSSDLPSSSTVPATLAQKKQGLTFTRTGQKNDREQGERRTRGSIIRRILSSCRRGLSRAARTIGGGCALVSCRRSSRTM
ncbi:microtubule-associated serine/threonine-protein kinase 4-like [Rhinoderma darwinii]|uniref:microtubule-associated serine/threonine-protein kinase 4-like n=1 Tax=Rhinoderma darwinii TaxID=43563 RepID=UPI003F6734BB